MEKIEYYISKFKECENKRIQLLGKLLEEECEEFRKNELKGSFFEYIGKRIFKLSIDRKFKDLKNKKEN